MTLDIVCNLSNGWARCHGRGDVMTSWYKSTCGETGVSFRRSAKRSLCICLIFLCCESYLVFFVLNHCYKLPDSRGKPARSPLLHGCVSLRWSPVYCVDLSLKTIFGVFFIVRFTTATTRYNFKFTSKLKLTMFDNNL